MALYGVLTSTKLFRVALLALILAANPAHIDPASAQSSDERAAFDSAKELGTSAAFNAFLKSYPSGFYAELAHAYLKKLGSESGAAAKAPSTPDERFPGVTGHNLEMARHQGGAFVKNGADAWVEQNATGTAVYRFKEAGRLDNEVQLFDGARGVYLGLDVKEAIVWYSDSQQPRRPLYQIIEARAGLAVPTQPVAQPAKPSKATPSSFASTDKPKPRPKHTRVTGCEEGQRLVNGRCLKISVSEKPQGCPKGTVPIPETDNCRPIRREVLKCKRGYRKIDGKCVKRDEVADFCGPGYRPKGGKCVPGAYQPPPKGSSRPQWQLDAIKKGCKPGQGWNPQEGCHEND